MFVFLLFLNLVHAREIALSFDDAPVESTPHFQSVDRTATLIKKLRALNVPPVMVFANPCKGTLAKTLPQLNRYRNAGHLIGNHTCSHPRLDDVGFEEYAKDAARADRLLSPFFSGQKFFRYPFLNESRDVKRRDQMREWLAQNDYRNGMVSVDNDDYMFSFKINEAKRQGKKFDLAEVERLFLEHTVGSAEFYDEVAIKTIGYSPKHVMLLHEMDATVMFIDSLVTQLRKRGWKIISVEEAYKDKLYLEQPRNIHANNGILAQLAFEKTGKRVHYDHWGRVKDKLDRILGL